MYSVLGVRLRMELLGHWVGICLALIDTAKWFSKVLVLTYTHSSNIRAFSLLFIIVNGIINLLHFGHSSRCVVVSHGGFNLHFADD